MRRARPSWWWERFQASDPDLSRLRMATRATLTTLLAILVLSRFDELFHQPITVAMVGVVVAMLGSTSVQDPDPRWQRWITLLVPIPAAASLIVGTLLSPWRVIGDAAFVVVIFASVYVRRFGSRGMSLGMIAFMTFFFALFFRSKPAQVPWMIAGIAVGTVVAYGVRFGLVPDRPAAQLRQATRAYRSSIRLMLDFLADALARPGWGSHRQRTLRRVAASLNEAAIEIEQHLDEATSQGALSAGQQEQVRGRVIELELGAERVATLCRRLAQGELSSERRRQCAEALRRTRRVLEEGSAARIEGALPPLELELNALLRADAALVTQAGPYLAQKGKRTRPARARAARSEAGAAAAPAQSRGNGGNGSRGPFGMRETTRHAIQATVAGGVALVLGTWISPTRWYWAVIAAFVVFSRASTFADTVARAVQRILGTIVGVVGALFVAQLIRGNHAVELAVLFACIFLSYYLWRVSYAWLVLFFTLLLAALYSLLGRYTPELMYLRLVETLVGAGVGALTSVLVLPSRARFKVRSTLAELLRAFTEYLEVALVRPREGAGSAELLARVRAMDRKLRELRDLGRPLRGMILPVPSSSVRLVHASASLAFFARQFASCEPWLELNAAAGEEVQRVGRRMVERAESIAELLEGRATAIPPRNLRAHRAAMARAEDSGDVEASSAMHWLAQMSELLDEIAEMVQPPQEVRGVPERVRRLA